MNETTYNDLHSLSTAPSTRDAFWLNAASQLSWISPPTIGHDPASVGDWFSDGILNISYNCLDRHVIGGNGGRTALTFISPQAGIETDITYNSLLSSTVSFSLGLSSLGVKKGDVVLIYSPNIPEAAVAMLACARIGAAHCVVFGGFAAKELAVRIDSAKPRVVVSAELAFEGGKVLRYMPSVNEAIATAKHKVESVVVIGRAVPDAAHSNAAHDVESNSNSNDDHKHKYINYVEYQNLLSLHHCDPIAPTTPAPAAMSATDTFYTLYTSGTTGSPKGVVRSCANAVTMCWSLGEEGFYDVDGGKGEATFTGSDIGWIVGHAYIIYAPLLNGAKSILFEGKPVGTPDSGIYWDIIERHKVVKLFTAPTALRAIRKFDPRGDFVKGRDLSSLRNVYVAGERCDPDTVIHFERLLNTKIVDHWWQTESGGPMVGMQIDRVGTVPGSCSLPLPGYNVKILDEAGVEVETNTVGSIALKLPTPPGFVTTLVAPASYEDKYLKEFEGFYSAGDSGFFDDNGYLHVMSRTDDIINVSAHRLSTGALEEAVLNHERVVECAVVGMKDDLKGEVPVALIVLSGSDSNENVKDENRICDEVKKIVRDDIGAFAGLAKVGVCNFLPKTRSGKILRGTLKKIFDDEDYVFPSTIENAEVLADVTKVIENIK